MAAQWDYKRALDRIPQYGVILYMTLMLMSMNLRLAKTVNDGLGKRLGTSKRDLVDMYDAMRKPIGFNATQVRLSKKGRIGFLVSNCAETRIGGLPMAYIRELFAFEFVRYTGLPVHALGRCPITRVERTGLSEEQAQALRLQVKPMSAVDIMSQYKFMIVFENFDGIISEKIHNAYLADTIPIYFGAYREDLERAFNMKSFIHCNFPQNISISNNLSMERRKICFDRSNKTSVSCIYQFEQYLTEKFRPFFEMCIRDIMEVDSNDQLYDDMLSQQFYKMNDDGTPADEWNFDWYAEVIRMAMIALGYDEKLL
jgi:hypothetical protein